ncbi:MAG: hypothetical protein ACR2KU_05330 [Gammaproteobacteria bacterium]|nr:hypothetical protein [Gammaproteobacteria bacterium]
MKAQPSSVRMLPEQTVLSAWREQLTQATPDLSQTLVNQQPELLPRGLLHQAAKLAAAGAAASATAVL